MGFEDVFGHKELNPSEMICHSGGALGSDATWETKGDGYGVKTKAYSYKTEYHNSTNKVEISEEDFLEGIDEVNKANRHLGRYGIHKYMNLLARDWSQIKHSDQIFAVGYIVEPGGKSPKGYYSKSKYQTVDGGTGYGVMMGINHDKDVFVFEQDKRKWYRWSHDMMSFLELSETPRITCNNFAGIGTRNITKGGIAAIDNVYRKTFPDIDI